MNWKQQLAVGVAGTVIGGLVLAILLRSGGSAEKTVTGTTTTVAVSTTTLESASSVSTTPGVTTTISPMTTPEPVRTVVELDTLRVDSAGYYADTISIDGQLMSGAYSPSWSKGGYADFNLSRRFSVFTARVGLIDRSSASVSGDLTITADGRTIYSRSFLLGQSDDIELDVSNVLRLRIQWDLLRLGAEGGVGNPKVQ